MNEVGAVDGVVFDVVADDLWQDSLVGDLTAGAEVEPVYAGP